MLKEPLQNASPKLVYVIDDDPAIRLSCNKILKKEGYRVETFEDGQQGLERLQERQPDLVVVDLKMPRIGGIDVIKRVNSMHPDISIVVITGYATIDTAVEAMKAGAYDFLPKPFTPEELRLIVNRGLERSELTKKSQRLTTELRTINEELRQINRNYMEILGFVSHEVKNALGNMIGSVALIEEENLGQINESQREMLKIFLKNCIRLQDMIRNYLDLSRLEKGEVTVRKRFVNYHEVIVAPLIEELHPVIQLKSMAIEREIPESLTIYADPDLLKIIIFNLLNNAIKYGMPHGRIRLDAMESGNNWLFGIWNEGEGIPGEQLSKLFVKFDRLQTESAARESGSGLGLYITRELVEKQDGEIWAESEYGKWVWFRFRLPKPRKTDY
jgi:two-component system, sensor histidine kinase and response regulator